MAEAGRAAGELDVAGLAGERHVEAVDEVAELDEEQDGSAGRRRHRSGSMAEA
jgi:hypothetical protein